VIKQALSNPISSGNGGKLPAGAAAVSQATTPPPSHPSLGQSCATRCCMGKPAKLPPGARARRQCLRCCYSPWRSLAFIADPLCPLSTSQSCAHYLDSTSQFHLREARKIENFQMEIYVQQTDLTPSNIIILQNFS
jgi:hypothetical protein